LSGFTPPTALVFGAVRPSNRRKLAETSVRPVGQLRQAGVSIRIYLGLMWQVWFG
jgi:hypothetical protein